jgi:hypothetical protein
VQLVHAGFRQNRSNHYLAGGDPPKERLPPCRLLVGPGRASHPPRPSDEPGAEDVHVGGERGRAVTPPEPVYTYYIVVNRVHAETAELRWHGGPARAASPHRLDVLYRKASLPVVSLGARRKVAGMLLGECDEPVASRGERHNLEIHARASQCPSKLQFGGWIG